MKTLSLLCGLLLIACSSCGESTVVKPFGKLAYSAIQQEFTLDELKAKLKKSGWTLGDDNYNYVQGSVIFYCFPNPYSEDKTFTEVVMIVPVERGDESAQGACIRELNKVFGPAISLEESENKGRWKKEGILASLNPDSVDGWSVTIEIEKEE